MQSYKQNAYVLHLFIDFIVIKIYCEVLGHVS